MKTIDDDEFKKREAKIRKSKARIRINTKRNEGVKIWRSSENFKRWKMGIWNSALGTYSRNRGRILVNEDQVTKISDIDDEEENLEKNVTLRSDDTFKDETGKVRSK